MSTTLICPNCGGKFNNRNPGLVSYVCQFCHVIVYHQENGQQAGKQAILPKSNSRLALSATGVLNNRPFTVVGHLHFEYTLGYWDEWYLRFEDGSFGWVLEKERVLAMLCALPQSDSPLDITKLDIGQSISFDTVDVKSDDASISHYTVRSADNAVVAGFAGEVDRNVTLEESFSFVELATHRGDLLGYIRQYSNQIVETWRGTPMEHQDLVVNPPITVKANKSQSDTDYQNLSQALSQVILCAGCKAPLETLGDGQLKTQVCEYCGTQHDFSHEEMVVLGKTDFSNQKSFQLNIGDPIQSGNVAYQVCGRTAWNDNSDRTVFRYLCFNSEEGYLWVEECKGHYVLFRPSLKAPKTNVAKLQPSQEVGFDRQMFRRHESGSRELVYVDGAMPWRLTRGYKHEYVSLVCAPNIFVEELHNKSLECYRGKYLRPNEIEKVLGIPLSKINREGIHGAQTFIENKQIEPPLGAFALLILLMIGSLLASIVFAFLYNEKELYQSFTEDAPSSVYRVIETNPHADKIRLSVIAYCASTACELSGRWRMEELDGDREVLSGVLKSKVDRRINSDSKPIPQEVASIFVSSNNAQRIKLNIKVDSMGVSTAQYRVKVYATNSTRPWTFVVIALVCSGIILILFGYVVYLEVNKAHKRKQLEIDRWKNVEYGLDTLDLSSWDYTPTTPLSGGDNNA